MNDVTKSAASFSLQDRIALLAGYLVLFLMGLRTASNTDAWSHLAAGKAITLAGLKGPDPLSWTAGETAAVNTTWLYDLIMFKLHAAVGMGGLTLLHMLAVVGAFLVAGHLTRGRASGTAIGMALLLSSWILAPRFEVRPEIFALLFSALFMFTASQVQHTWTRWGILIPLQIVWANMGGSFLLGPVIVLAFAVGYWRKAHTESGDVTPKDLVLRAGLAGVLLVASAVNPYGPKLISEIMAGSLDKTSVFLMYFISPISTEFRFGFSFWILNASMVLGLLGFMLHREKLPLSLTILAVFGAVTPSAGKFMGMHTVSMMDQYALLAFPFFCLSFQAIGLYLKQQLKDLLKIKPPLPTYLGQGLFALLAVVSAGSLLSNGYYVRAGHLSSFGLGANLDFMPAQAVTVLEKDAVHDRLLNLPLDGGYIALVQDQLKVFTDQRPGLRDAAFYDSFYAALSNSEPDAWKNLMREWNPQLAVINAVTQESAALLGRCLTQGKWGLVYFDGTSAVLATRTPENLPLFSDPTLLNSGLVKIESAFQQYREELGGPVNAPIPPRLVGAAHVFFNLSQFSEALVLYTHLTAGAPFMRGAWLNRGVCELGLAQYEAAEQTLRHASRLMPKDARVWASLALAYEKQEKETEAASAYAQAAALNPEYTEAFRKQQKSKKNTS